MDFYIYINIYKVSSDITLGFTLVSTRKSPNHHQRPPLHKWSIVEIFFFNGLPCHYTIFVLHSSCNNIYCYMSPYVLLFILDLVLWFLDGSPWGSLKCSSQIPLLTEFELLVVLLLTKKKGKICEPCWMGLYWITVTIDSKVKQYCRHILS